MKNKIFTLIFLFCLTNCFAQINYLAYNFDLQNSNNRFKFNQIKSIDNNIYWVDSLEISQKSKGLVYRKNVYKSFFTQLSITKYNNNFIFKTKNYDDTVFNIQSKGISIIPNLGWYFYNRKIIKLFFMAGINIYTLEKTTQIKKITYGTGEYDVDEYGSSYEIMKTDKYQIYNQFDNILLTNQKYKINSTFEIGFYFEFIVFWGLGLKYESDLNHIIKNNSFSKNLSFNGQIGFLF